MEGGGGGGGGEGAGAEAGTGGSSSQYMKGEHEELKTLLKNTCEGVHLLAKLPAKSLQI